MRSIFLALFMFVALFNTGSLANPFCQKEDRNNTEEFGCIVDQKFFTCALESQVAFLEWQLGKKNAEESVQRVTNCISKSQNEVEVIYKKSKAELKKLKNEDALNALKALYSYWLSSMVTDVLVRSPRQSEVSYNLQIRARKIKLGEKVNNLKVEL